MYYEVIIDHIDQIMITFPCVHCVHYIDELCNQFFIKLFSIGSLHCDQNKGKVQKKDWKKLTSVSFMYVCVAKNGEMLVFFVFFPNNSLIDNSLSE